MSGASRDRLGRLAAAAAVDPAEANPPHRAEAGPGPDAAPRPAATATAVLAARPGDPGGPALEAQLPTLDHLRRRMN